MPHRSYADKPGHQDLRARPRPSRAPPAATATVPNAPPAARHAPGAATPASESAQDLALARRRPCHSGSPLGQLLAPWATMAAPALCPGLWQAAMGTGAKAAGLGQEAVTRRLKAQAPPCHAAEGACQCACYPLTGAARGPGRLRG
jgi:hypothetical protein